NDRVQQKQIDEHRPNLLSRHFRAGDRFGQQELGGAVVLFLCQHASREQRRVHAAGQGVDQVHFDAVETGVGRQAQRLHAEYVLQRFGKHRQHVLHDPGVFRKGRVDAHHQQHQTAERGAPDDKPPGANAQFPPENHSPHALSRSVPYSCMNTSSSDGSPMWMSAIGNCRAKSSRSRMLPANSIVSTLPLASCRTMPASSACRTGSARVPAGKARVTVLSRALSRPLTDSTRTSRPSRMMATRWHSRCTSLRMWEEKNTVAPRSRSSRSRSKNSCCMRGSRPPVGSSRMSRRGLCRSAWMMPTFFRLP